MRSQPPSNVPKENESPSSTNAACRECPETGARDVTSPELELVSPDLREARQQLPDRPWELALARAQTSRPSGQAPDGRDQASRPPSEASSQGPREPREELVGARMDVPIEPRPARWRLILPFAVGALVAVAISLNAWTGSGEEDVGERRSAPDGGLQATTVGGPTSLLPNAGYVVSPRGSFMTDASGGTIVFFTLPIRCGGSQRLVIRDIPVSGPRFSLTAKAVGRAISVRLRGELLSRERVLGFASAVGPTCSQQPVAFEARLS
jgi:hypothetical protein